MVFNVEKENMYILLEEFMKEKFLITKDMDMVFTNILMEINMKDNGQKITNKEKVNSFFLLKKMVVEMFTKDNLIKVNSLDLVIMFTESHRNNILVSGKMINGKDMVNS